MADAMEPDDLLGEQIAYYRARAPEYDEWAHRRGIFDLGPDVKSRWETDVAEVRRALDGFSPSGRVLELACGTGWWTQQLARHADELTAVDASPETIAIARTKATARYVVADIFEWTPDRRFDVAFFSFWLSHVPASRFEAFFDLLDRALHPTGRIFFIDNKGQSQTPSVRRFLQRDTTEDGVVIRRLNDGREFRAVKIYYEPDELTAKLRDLGWSVDIRTTPEFFYYGWGARG